MIDFLLGRFGIFFWNALLMVVFSGSKRNGLVGFIIYMSFFAYLFLGFLDGLQI